MGNGAIGCNWGTGVWRKTPATATAATYRHRVYRRLYRHHAQNNREFRGLDVSALDTTGLEIDASELRRAV